MAGFDIPVVKKSEFAAIYLLAGPSRHCPLYSCPSKSPSNSLDTTYSVAFNEISGENDVVWRQPASSSCSWPYCIYS